MSTQTGSRPTPTRRWVADPLAALVVVGGLVVALITTSAAGHTIPPAGFLMLGVTAAGLALSGST
ncbi:hypothetical protein [Janibacter anophelis]|uniref:hypothetical protein n=1 Tax=Janibacter anophelis TaxID=319054 RepID=UPI00082B2409|nr:hypothetical protein [Janibacter anophelis]